MFDSLGKLVTRGWPWLLIAWVLALAGLTFVAPDWDDVAQAGQFVFLPDDAPSRTGQALFDKAFPDDLLASSVVIVAHRADGSKELTQTDRTFLANTLKPAIEQLAADEGGLAKSTEISRSKNGQSRHSIIAQVLTPSDRVMGPLLVSADRKAALVIVDLTTDYQENRNWPVIEKIENLISSLKRDNQAPPQLELSLTGSATLGRDMARAESRSAEATRFWTLLLVIVLLVVIYRAPLLALVPLLTLFVAVAISLRLLALMAQGGWIGLFTSLQVYITVLVYGAGVDYCLFLTARYKEHLDAGATYRDALSQAIGRVGAPLVASAGTVICGIGMLTFARFGKFHEAGIAISFSLFIVLCATLTFTPALLRLAGRWAFWPHVPHQSEAATPRWVLTLNRLMGESLFERLWQAIGRKLLARPGTILALSLAAMGPFVVIGVLYYEDLSYGLVNELPEDAPSRAGARVLGQHFPAGITGTATVLLQDNRADFTSLEGIRQIDDLVQHLKERKQELQIADIRSVANPLGVGEAAAAALAKESAMTQFLERGAVRKRAAEYYVSKASDLKGHVTRLDIVLTQDPFSRSAIGTLERIEDTIRTDPVARNTEISAIGSTASIRDLQTVGDNDRLRVNSLATVVVFVILVLLLRQVFVSLYLIASVLCSYLAALGATYVLFRLVAGEQFDGLDWTVPMFLFTVLVAVGEDYNIFLITRIEEEQQQHGPLPGITLALSRTGAIISSCGFIMAGTFSSLMAGSLARMHQLGFALAFGVLLDTFVVRPILVPAFLILLHNGSLGSFGRYVAAPPRHPLLEEAELRR